MALFKAREIREGADVGELRRQLNEALKLIERDLSTALRPRRMSEVITASTYAPGYGDVVRVAPPSGGLRLVLPEANLAALDARVTVVQVAASGALSVEVVNGTINGAATLSYLAGVGTVEFVLTAEGWYGWSVSMVNDLPLTALADQAANTVLANATASAAPPTAVAISADSLLARIAANIVSHPFSTVAGAGLTYGSGALAVGAGHAVAVAADAVAVTPSALRGIGLTASATVLTPRQRPRAAQVRDYFLSGTAATGAIGALGWNLLGTGTPAAARQSVATGLSNSSKLALTTSAGANDRSVLSLGESETRDVIQADEVTLMQAVWNHDNNLTSKRVFFGLMGTFAAEAAAAVDALGIYYDSAVSANYQIIARSGSTGSPTVTAAVVPANTGELLSIHQPTAGTFNFYVGNTLVGTISSGLPTVAMNVGFRLETLTTAAKTVNLGYFGLEAIAAAAFDDDAVFEA